MFRKNLVYSPQLGGAESQVLWGKEYGEGIAGLKLSIPVFMSWNFGIQNIQHPRIWRLSENSVWNINSEESDYALKSESEVQSTPL